MARTREQKLVDIMFQVAQTSATHFAPESEEKYYSGGKRDEHMDWVAQQLSECGFHTKQMGSSWGVLCEKPPSDKTKGITVVSANRPD